jgi:hypothetical protein
VTGRFGFALCRPQGLTGSWALSVATREIVHLSGQIFEIFDINPEAGMPTLQTLVERRRSCVKHPIANRHFAERATVAKLS